MLLTYKKAIFFVISLMVLLISYSCSSQNFSNFSEQGYLYTTLEQYRSDNFDPPDILSTNEVAILPYFLTTSPATTFNKTNIKYFLISSDENVSTYADNDTIVTLDLSRSLFFPIAIGDDDPAVVPVLNLLKVSSGSTSLTGSSQVP